VEVVASLSQGRTATAQCGLFTHKSVPVIFETPCTWFTSHIYRNTLDVEWLVTLYLDRWSRDNVVVIVTRLRASRLGVRIQAVAVDISFLRGLSIALGPT